MPAEFTGWLRLKDDSQVRVKLCVFEDPALPTHGESEIARPPMVTEWAEIVGRMAAMNFERIEA